MLNENTETLERTYLSHLYWVVVKFGARLSILLANVTVSPMRITIMG